MTEEQLVLEGRKLKILCAKRQIAAAEQSGIIIDTLRFTVPQRRLLEQERLADDFDAGDLEPAQIAHYFAQVFAQLLGFQLGGRKNGRDYHESSWTIKNAQDCEMGSVSAGGASGTTSFSPSKARAAPTPKKAGNAPFTNTSNTPPQKSPESIWHVIFSMEKYR